MFQIFLVSARHERYIYMCGSLIARHFFANKYFSWKPVQFRRILTHFSQIIHLPLPWQRERVGMKAVLIIWFCLAVSKIGKLQQQSVLMSTTARYKTRYRELLNIFGCHSNGFTQTSMKNSNKTKNPLLLCNYTKDVTCPSLLCWNQSKTIIQGRLSGWGESTPSIKANFF